MKRKSDGDSLATRAIPSRRVSSKRRAVSLGPGGSKTPSPVRDSPPRQSIEASQDEDVAATAQEALDLLNRNHILSSNTSNTSHSE